MPYAIILVDFLVNRSDAEDYKKRTSPEVVNPIQTHNEKPKGPEDIASEDPEPDNQLSAINA